MVDTSSCFRSDLMDLVESIFVSGGKKFSRSNFNLYYSNLVKVKSRLDILTMFAKRYDNHRIAFLELYYKYLK